MPASTASRSTIRVLIFCLAIGLSCSYAAARKAIPRDTAATQDKDKKPRRPSGFPPVPLVSPEVRADGGVTFRLRVRIYPYLEQNSSDLMEEWK